MRRTIGFVGLLMLTVAAASGPVSCGSADKAGIMLNVSTAADVDRSTIVALQVTVNGRTQSYAVGTASTWSLGIETSAGSKVVAVQGVGQGGPVPAVWQGVIAAVAGQVVNQDVLLQALGTAPAGTGGAPGVDGGSSDAPVAMGTGGIGGAGGFPGTGGLQNLGGGPGTGGLQGLGGAVATGGAGAIPSVGGGPGVGGTLGKGGGLGSGGAMRTGGVLGSGGSRSGGAPGTGGVVVVGTGGTIGTGGIVATGGSVSTGGRPSTGGIGGACMPNPIMTGGTTHSGNAEGNAAGFRWMLWSTMNSATLTTYDTPSFSVSWSNSGDTLARYGLQLGGSKTFEQYGAISAEFAETKTGSSGGSDSYIGLYGWSLNPCVEFYIVEDSFSQMPISIANASAKGTATIDGETYSLYSKATSTTDSRCTGTSGLMQFYSVRQSARQCGEISVSQHFQAWKGAGMMLGKLDQVMVVAETMGGVGTVGFPTAIVTVPSLP